MKGTLSNQLYNVNSKRGKSVNLARFLLKLIYLIVTLSLSEEDRVKLVLYDLDSSEIFPIIIIVGSVVFVFPLVDLVEFRILIEHGA